MRCPVCNAYMTEGWLQSPAQSFWSPKRHYLVGGPDLGGFKFRWKKYPLVQGIKAFNCNSCKKLIVDYSDEDVQFNR